MIGDREHRTLDDIDAIWLGHGVELAKRIQDFIHEIRGLDLTADQVADQLYELLTTDHEPLPEPLRPRPQVRNAIPQLTAAPPRDRRRPDPGAC